MPQLGGMVFRLEPYHSGMEVRVRQQCAEMELVTPTPMLWGHRANTTIVQGRIGYNRWSRRYDVTGRYRVPDHAAPGQEAWVALTGGAVGTDPRLSYMEIDLDASREGRRVRLRGVEK